MIGRKSRAELLKWVYNSNQVFTAKFKLFASFSQDRGSILALRLIITSAQLPQNQRGYVDSSSHFYVFAKCIQHFPSSRPKCNKCVESYLPHGKITHLPNRKISGQTSSASLLSTRPPAYSELTPLHIDPFIHRSSRFLAWCCNFRSTVGKLKPVPDSDTSTPSLAPTSKFRLVFKIR